MDNIKFYITEDYDELSKVAADIIASQIKEKPNSVMGLATGSTPVGAYKNLIEMHKAGNLDFSSVTTFNLDEYYPIKKSSDQSYDYFMKKNLFSHVNLTENLINIPNGEAEDIAKECDYYELKIKNAGGIDMQLLGMGLNGHIGFNEPSDTYEKRTHYVHLEQSTINANSRFFESIDLVPRNAITMGIKTIMMSEKILLLVNGAAKADILEKVLLGEITPQVPASILQLHRNVIVVADKEAAKKVIK